MRIVICDDDASIREQYSQILRTILEKNAILQVAIQSYDSGETLLKQWQWSNTDVLFLDIHMPIKDGVEVANELRAKGYQGEIIFLTVSKQHAVHAFNVDAFHYLVKGDTDQTKIEKVFMHAYADLIEKERTYITLSRGGDLRNIAVDSIYYFEMKNRRLTVYYQENESFEFYSTLDKIEKELKDEGFVRVHQGFLVNMNKSKKSQNTKEINIVNGDVVPIGIRYAKRYEERLDCGLDPQSK